MTPLLRFFFAPLMVLMLALPAGRVAAQVTPMQQAAYAEWLKVADRAEQVIQTNRASRAALEKLRIELAGYRERFLGLRDENASRIKTLEARIGALGPPPAEGETEAEDIAVLRDRLNNQLDALRVPRVVADEAYSRANGLISEVDRIIRERQARRLLHRGPSPLLPRYWGEALDDLGTGLRQTANETSARLATPATIEQLRDNGPLVAGLMALGLVLLFRARPWATRFGDYLRGFGGRGTGVWGFVVSIARALLPLAGIVAIVKALELTGIPGVRGALILDAVPRWAAIFVFFWWLADQLLIRRMSEELLPIPAKRKAQAQMFVLLLALMLVLHEVVNLFEQLNNISEASRAVLGFPMILSAALLIARLRRFRERPAEGDADVVTLGANAVGVVRVVRQAVFFLAVASPILAAAGFTYAAEAIIYPVILTLAVISVVFILQNFVTDLYAWVWDKGDAARDSLFSVVAGFVLALLSLPVLALIWGARVADLTEMWTRFLSGFDLGSAHISPTGFVIFAIVFGTGYAATRLVQSGLRNALLPKTRMDPGGQNAVVAGTGYVGIFLAALVAVTAAGLDLSSIAIVAGALSVGIGFGLQNIVSNFVSGIILLIERPIAKGDWIEVGGMMGYVRDISVRSTRVETFDRTDVIVPNSDLVTGTVTNFTRGNTIGRVIVPVGVAYGTDTRMVEKILLEIANGHPMVLANPAPNVVFQGFGADSLDFEIRAILRDVNWVLSVKSDMNYEIDKRFRDAGIEIPFAQRDIWLRNPEALTGATAAGPAPSPSPAPSPGEGAAPERPILADLHDMDPDNDI